MVSNVLPKNFVVEGLQAQLQIIKKERDRMAGELAVLRQTTANLSRDLAESKANEIEAQTEAAHCKEKLDKLRTSHETIQKQARAEIETLQKQVNNMRFFNVQTLVDQKGKIEALRNIDILQLQQNNSELSQDLYYSKLQQAVTQAQLKHQQEETAELAKQLETSRNTEYYLRRKWDAVETQNTDYLNTIEASNQLYKNFTLGLSRSRFYITYNKSKT
jgi:chromosome segregation ATPase